ncbi:MAG: hypothetical protein HY585_03345, partial [Candidatus Omnitrophica bacterium]|nr:hypothetical protein [Candidatus Omnitrophota bacterium]
FLDAQNLHFGYSAFIPLQALLAKAGVNVSAKEIALKSILIDILIGAINPFTEDRLKISLFALERTAHVYGVSPKAVGLSFEDLLAIYAQNANAELVIHIRGEHYVVLTGVTEEKVTYRETASGPNGEIVELTKEQFLELWLNPDLEGDQGVALVPESVQVSEDRILDRKLTQLIRGADCGIISIIVVAIVVGVIGGTIQAITASGGNFVTNFLKGFAFAAITSVATAGIGAILGSFANAVGGLVQGVLNSVKTFVAPIVNGIKAIGLTIGRFISNFIPTSISHFLSGAANLIGKGITSIGSFVSRVANVAISGVRSLSAFINSTSGLKHVIAKTVMETAVSIGSNKGLRALGVNPKIAALTSAFVVGGVLGSVGFNVPTGISGIEGFVQGGVAGLATTAIPAIGNAFNIAPELSSLLGIVSSGLINLGGDFSNTVLKGFNREILGEFVISGATIIGERLGLDPRLASLVSIPIRSSVQGLVDSLLNANGGGGPGILSSIKDSLFSKQTVGSFISVGGAIVSEALNINPILTAIALKGLTSAVKGFVTGNKEGSTLSRILSGFTTGVAGFGEDLIRSAGNPVLLNSLTQGKSLGDILEQYATGVLYRSSLEDLVAVHGTIKAAYEDALPRAKTFISQGKNVTELELKGQTTSTFILRDTQTGGVLRIQTDNRILEGEIAFRPDGTAYVINGTVTERQPGNVVYLTTYENNQIIQMQILGESSHIDVYGIGDNPVTFYKDGTIKEGVIENLTDGKKTTFTNETIRVEKIEATSSPFGTGGVVNFRFYQKGDIAQYELYDRNTGDLIDEGVNVIQDSRGSFIALTPPDPTPSQPDTIVNPTPQAIDLFAADILEQGFRNVLVNKLPGNGETLVQDLRQYFASEQEMVNFIKAFDGAVDMNQKLALIEQKFGVIVGDAVREGTRQSLNKTQTIPTFKFTLFEKDVTTGQTPETQSKMGLKVYTYATGDDFISSELIKGNVSIDIDSGIGSGKPGITIGTKFGFNSAEGIRRTIAAIPGLDKFADQLTGTVTGERDDGTPIEVSGRFDLGHRFTLNVQGPLKYNDDLRGKILTMGSEQEAELDVILTKQDNTK